MSLLLGEKNIIYSKCISSNLSQAYDHSVPISVSWCEKNLDIKKMINILEIEIFSPGQNYQKTVVKKITYFPFTIPIHKISKYNFSFICDNNSNLLDQVKCQGQQNIPLRNWIVELVFNVSRTCTRLRTFCNIDKAERLRNYYRIGHVHCVKWL